MTYLQIICRRQNLWLRVYNEGQRAIKSLHCHLKIHGSALMWLSSIHFYMLQLVEREINIATKKVELDRCQKH
ncbi:Hypothetical predicted protein [Podarcis lilfordi]|uniref:Uncharacterized protein n=1 Tax=Podarcis lilfordi TaxID=74358 RepID=A0AA35K4N1_9SAUR|nr:Hypothetical predicted protein [Podarcis lilfordi]